MSFPLHKWGGSGDQDETQQQQQPLAAARSASNGARHAPAFAYFDQLPVELKIHTLSFLPARSLAKAVSPVNRHCKALVEIIIQRKLSSQVQPELGAKNRKRDREGRGPSSIVVFEAQRPIDTLTARHALHFSHFGGSTKDEQLSPAAECLFAHFDFVPQHESRVSSAIRSGCAKGDDHDDAVHLDPTVADIPSTQATASLRTLRIQQNDQNDVGPTLGQPSLLGVLESDRHRLRQEHISSSLPTSGSTTPRGRLQQFSNLSQNLSGSALAQLERYPEEVPINDLRSSSPSAGEASRRDDTAADRGRGQGYEQSDTADGIARNTSLWSEPVSSSMGVFGPNTEGGETRGSDPQGRLSDDIQQSFRARCSEPMYKFQLDTLDSFETWILSLTVQRRSAANEGAAPSLTAAYQQRWEKRVAEGLDRVFRDWFRPSQTQQQQQQQGLSTSLGGGTGMAAPFHLPAATSHLSAMGQSMPHQRAMGARGWAPQLGSHAYGSVDPTDARIASYIDSFPDPRTLEIDGPGCTVMMQPHANPDADTHPALASMSSHYYLSSSSPYVASQTAPRVEYTFHCKSVRINAARLLSTLEDIEDDIQRARLAASAASSMRGRVVAMTSGGSSWTPTNSGSNPYLSTAPRGRWSAAGADAPTAVVVFGAARD